ncbi:fibrinogen-like protein 1 [Cololabis saira]|uniref:fibrinogen-like protein 1 n=1 Tax=Cololabis saira TaxID=129043 RepID=UPI002AD501BD|nr:fibrinogen-like protein 1 [Cololabis saira]
MKDLTGFRGLVLVLLLSSSQQSQVKVQVLPPQVSCSEIKSLSPQASSGVYTIQPEGTNTPFQVYCEMLSDGGWTVFQRRTGEPLSFEKNWENYKNGFGYPANDHWLGLEKVYLLTEKKSITLRVKLWDFEGGSAFAEYENFRLGDEGTAYELHVGEYRGNAGDAIRGAYPGVDQNGYGFSTVDRDNDGCNPCIFGDIATHQCVDTKRSGWWFSKCGSADLNGHWNPSGDHIGVASGLHWETWKSWESLAASRMMIKSY